MSTEVVLSAALRNNLASLQKTQSSVDKIQGVLSTGLKVSSALDNPQNYFASQALKDRSNDLTSLLDGIGQSIQTIKAADAGQQAITSLISQADSIVNSAREALTGGQVQASIKGNVSLTGKSDLTTILGVSNTDALVFSYYNTSGTLTTANVAIATGDSTDQLLGKINDIGGGGFFKASLTTDGFLQITEQRGNSFNINAAFNGNATAVGDPQDSALLNALGFGAIVNTTTRNGGVVANFNSEITVLAKTKLTSGTFFEAGVGNGFAEGSDLLTTVVNAKDATAGAATSRFINASAGDPLTLTFKINGTTSSAAIDIQTLTIQGLVDAVNGDTSVNSLISASYDATTGSFNISALSSSVQTIQLTATDTVAAGAGNTTVDFDFGTKASLLPTAGANDADAETYYLASAASTLSRLQGDYDTVRSQIDKLASDAGYRGTNLLNGDTLTTFFNENRTNKLSTAGSVLSSTGLGLTAANFSTSANVEATSAQILAAKTTLRSFGTSIANSLSIIQTRESFTKALINTITEGSDKLTVADQNESGAKLLALQTRQSLGVTALSLASQASQAVLRLF